MVTQHTKSLLEQSYEQREPFVVGDDGATTWESVGVIFLAIIFSQSRLVEYLSELTGLPTLFLDAAVSIFEEDGWWFRLEFADLVLAASEDAADLTKTHKAIDNLMEAFWGETDLQSLAVLEELRAGFIFGGQKQWWVDTENSPVLTRYSSGVN